MLYSSFDPANPDLTVCIVGGGNAAHALGALFPSRSIRTRIYAPVGDEAARIQQGLEEQGELHAEFASHNNPAGLVCGKPELVSKDAAEVIPGSDVLILPLPSFAYRDVLTQVKPYLKPGTVIAVTPGQGGFDWVAREVLGDLLDQLVIYALLPMPFNCRISEFGKRVEVQEFKRNYKVAVRPAAAEDAVIALNTRLFGHTESCGDFLAATLYPINAVIHPARLYQLCKDYKEGDFLPENPLFYEQMDAETAGYMDRVNQELLEVSKTLREQGVAESLDVPHIFDFLAKYTYQDDSADLQTFFTTNPAYKGFRCPFIQKEQGWVPDFANRYFTEDIPLGLCIYKGVAELAEVETPFIDTIIQWAQGHMGKEYLVDGRLAGRDLGETYAPQRFGITSRSQL